MTEQEWHAWFEAWNRVTEQEWYAWFEAWKARVAESIARLTRMGLL